MTLARYAVYWAPETRHPLWRAGCSWLGYDAFAPAAACAPMAPAGLANTPRRYGFHATLKAPMHLRAGRSEHELHQALVALAAQHHAFDLPPLALAWLDDFLALRLANDAAAPAALQALADDCVRQLDAFRAPLSVHDRQRHAAVAAPLRWGYPYVLKHWRFHLTLSERLGPADTAQRLVLQQAAQRHFVAALRAPLRIASLCLFVQPAPDASFVAWRRVALAN